MFKSSPGTNTQTYPATVVLQSSQLSKIKIRLRHCARDTQQLVHTF